MKRVPGPSRNLILLMVVAVCVAVTVTRFVRLRNDARHEYQSTFDRDADLRLHIVTEHLEDHLTDLDSVRHFYLGSRLVERGEFAGFVRPLLARRRDIAAFAWVPDGGPSKLDPSVPIYLEARSGTADLDGVELALQPAVRVLLEEATANGIATALTAWAPPGEQAARPVVLIATSVDGGLSVAASAGTASIRPPGHLIEILACGDILSSAIERTSPVGLATELVELRDGGAPVIIDRNEGRLPGPVQPGSGLRKSLEFPFAGRRWQGVVTDTLPYRQRHFPRYHTLVLPAGLSLTAMLALYLRSLFTRQRRIEQEVQSRTEELREREGHLRLIQETAPLAIVVWDLDRRVTEWNPAATALFGWKREEVLGRDFFSFLIPDDQRAQVDQVVHLLLQGRLPADSQNENATRDGRRVLCQWHNAVQRDARGAVTGVNSIGVDVTERLRAQAERERLLEELESANRELEGLIRATSHDLRSPLVSLMGFARRLERECEALRDLLSADIAADDLRNAVAPALQERIPAALGFILSSGEKMERLVAGLTRLSRTRGAVLHTRRIDMRELLRSITVGMAYQIQQAVAVVEFGELPPLEADPDLVSQVFSNLLDNALKYRELSRPPLIRIEGQAAAGYVRYTVDDNGRGIPAERREMIWELFSRLDPAGAIPGEGLGLAIVRRIVERHAGSISVDSEPGRGSRFVLEFPQREAGGSACRDDRGSGTPPL